jgi:hypothetical protein
LDRVTKLDLAGVTIGQRGQRMLAFQLRHIVHLRLPKTTGFQAACFKPLSKLQEASSILSALSAK